MDEKEIFQSLRFGLKFSKIIPKHLNKFCSAKQDFEQFEQITSDLNFFEQKEPLEKIPSKNEEPQRKRLKTEDCDLIDDKDITLCHQAKNPRKLHKIYVEGCDVPELILTFKQLQSIYKFNKICSDNIHNMGFEDLTPIQMQAIPAMMHGREILACAPTGSGKTLAFLIPVVHHLLSKPAKEVKKEAFSILILSPTKELAEQTLRECKQLVQRHDDEKISNQHLLRVKLLDKKETKIYMKTGAVHSKKIDILISTPNRLIHLLQQDPSVISLENVEWLIVDESDKLFEDGKNDGSFREQLGTIYSTCTNPKVRRAMFSATFAYDVQQWCLLNMDNVLQITIGGKNTAVESVAQELKYVGNEQGKLLALQQIMHQGFQPPVLVFVQSKERAKELFAELIYDGKNVDAIHADRTPTQRENAVKCFRKGDTWILICTELMGRGIDFKGVNLVINYDFPTSAVSYIHRIGRTGRAGRSGKAITFFTDEDKPLLRSIATVIRQAGCEIPKYMLKLKKPGRKDLRRIARQEVKRKTIRSAPPDMLRKHKQSAKKPTPS